MPLTPFARVPPSRAGAGAAGSPSSGSSTPSRSSTRRTAAAADAEQPASKRKSTASTRDLSSFLPDSSGSSSHASPRSVPLPASPESFESPSQSSSNGSTRRRTLGGAIQAAGSPTSRTKGQINGFGVGAGGSRLRESILPSFHNDIHGEEDEEEEESSGHSEKDLPAVTTSGSASQRPAFGTPIPRSQTLQDVATSTTDSHTSSPNLFLDSPSLAHQIRKSRSHMMFPSAPVRRESDDSDTASPRRTPGSTTASRSRSAITPFNMGANLQDGHKALERRKSQMVMKGSPMAPATTKSAPSTPIAKLAKWVGVSEAPRGGTTPSGASVHRPKVIRRVPLMDRLQNSISELVEDLSDRFSTLPPSFALPLAIFLQLVHFLARAPLFAAARHRAPHAGGTGDGDKDSVFRGDSILGDSATSSGSPFSWLGGFGRSNGSPFSDAGSGSVFIDEASKRRRLEIALEVEEAARRYTGLWSRAGAFLIFLLLAGFAIGNAYYLFSKRRRYDFRTRQLPIDSPNARAVPAVDSAELDVRSSSAKGLLAKLWRFCRRHLAPKVLHRFATDQWSKQSSAASARTMQRLEMWDPSEFNLLFFTYYSPLQPVLLQFMGHTHPWLALASCYLLTLTLKLIIREYNQLIKDKSILQAEVMKEYNEGFVYKAMFTPRQDAGTQTSQAEMIW